MFVGRLRHPIALLAADIRCAAWVGALAFAAALAAVNVAAAPPAAKPPTGDVAAATPVVVWLTGPKLVQQLKSPVSVQWSGQTLRGALESLSQTQQAAYFLDRRIDPGQRLDLTLQGVPLAEAFRAIAEKCGLGTCQFGPVAYFGPVDAAAQLRTLAEMLREQAAKLPPARRAALQRSAALRWPELTAPADVLAQLQTEAGSELRGREQVPHDLWPAVDLPPLTWTDRLSLVAIGFGLGGRLTDEGTVELAKVTRTPLLVRSYAAGSDPGKWIAKLTAQFPATEFKAAQGRLFVRGRVEEHEQVAALLSGNAPVEKQPPGKSQGNPPAGKPPATAQQVYTLKVENKPLRPVLAQLAKQIQFTLKFDDEAVSRAKLALDAPVSFQVRNASLDELLQAALAPAKLTFRRDGETITIIPAE